MCLESILQKVQMYSKFHIDLLCISVYGREGPVLVSHKEVGISVCHPASSFLLQSVSCIHFFFHFCSKSLYNYVTDHFSPLQSNNSFQCQKLSLMLCASKPNYDFSSCSSLYPHSSPIRYVQSLIYSTHTAWPHNVRYHDMYQVFKYSG